MPVPTLTINGISCPTLTAAFPAGGGLQAGVYYSLPPYGHPPYVAARNWDEFLVKFPGVDVVFRKRMGTFIRAIHVDLVIVGISLQNMEEQRETVMDALDQLDRYDVTFPGGTIYCGCSLVPGSGIITAEFYPSWKGTNSYCQLMAVDLVQLNDC